MSAIEELKQQWQQKGSTAAGPDGFTDASLSKIIRDRVKMHTRNSMKYFWASFTLQLMVYALLAHVIVRYGQQSFFLWSGIAGVLLFIPFTILLMQKFKQLATVPGQQHEGATLRDHVLRKQALLRSFYRFKKWYELLLVPLSCAIGVTLVFGLYVPGGVPGNLEGAGITFLISLASCAAAISVENRKSFVSPIQQLQELLDEFDGGDSRQQ